MHDDIPPVTSWVLTDVSLVIKKKDLDPAATTRRLGLEPSTQRNPGIDKWDPEGDTDGQWRIQCDERTEREFSRQLETILEIAESHRAQLHSLKAEGCEIVLAVGGFAGTNSQISLSASEVNRISSLEIPLTLTPNLNDR